jgi:hypothetical protein
VAKSHEGKELQAEKATGPLELEEALEALGIAPKNVLAFKVYDDRVVIIEGPGGKKRIWQKPKEEVVRSGG